MTQKEIVDSFYRTKKHLTSTFPPSVGRRLTEVDLKFVSRPGAKWFAYYDANRQYIAINAPKLKSRTQMFLTTLMTHELMHAAAEHHRSKEREIVRLKAGLRLETFSPKKKTHHEHLNEAFVSLLTRTHTGAWDLHYLLEQLVLLSLIKRIGSTHLEKAFFEDDFQVFVRHLEVTFGTQAMKEVLNAFERRRFDKLQKYLIN